MTHILDPENLGSEFDFLDELDPDLNCLPQNTSEYFDEGNLKSLLSTNSGMSKSFALFFLNVRSLPAKFDSLSAYMDATDLRCSIYGFAETWLKPDTDNLYQLRNYNYVSSVRQTRIGGGVCLQIHNSIKFLKIPNFTLNEDHIECVFIEVTHLPNATSKPIIGVVYRPPNSDSNLFFTEIERILSNVSSRQRPCYIMGDFNFDLLSIGGNNNCEHFSEIMHSNSFFPLIDKPTRIKPPSATLLDNIYTNCVQCGHTSGILYTDISDHLPVFTFNESLIASAQTSTRTYQSRSFSETNLNSFQRRLASINWNDLYADDSCESAYSQFLDVITSLYNESFPLITRRCSSKRNQPWISPQLKRQINQKNRLYKTYLKRPSLFNEINYKNAKVKTSRDIRSTKKLYYHQLLDQNRNNLRRTWSVIKEVMGQDRSTSSIDSVSVGGSLVTESSAIANHLNTYFTSIGSTLSNEIPPTGIDPLSYLNTNINHSFFMSPITAEELRSCILKLKDGSAGSDNIKPKIIKASADFLISPLLHIFNLSLSEGIVPTPMKRANVTPIFKGGDPRELGNYRPISVLTAFSKILEKLMFSRLYSYVTSNNILYNRQFGFRKGHSTELALLTAVDHITSALDKKSMLWVFS